MLIKCASFSSQSPMGLLGFVHRSQWAQVQGLRTVQEEGRAGQVPQVRLSCRGLSHMEDHHNWQENALIKYEFI